MNTINDYALTAEVLGDRLVCEGRVIGAASDAAQNEFGYAHSFTWAEAARLGITIWVEPNGIVWCEDPIDRRSIRRKGVL